MEQYFNELVQQFGIYAVFLLCMVEGDITLLLAGVLAAAGAFGNPTWWGYFQVIFFGTAGAVIGDFVGYLIGRIFRKSVNKYSFYRAAQPRIEQLTEKFGALSIFVSKFIYGIRAAWCIFYGVSGTPWYRFLLYDSISCFLWVFLLSSASFFFGSAVTSLIGDFKRVGFVLLIVLVVCVIGFYLFERFWISKKVEAVSPESLHELEKAAHITLHDLKENINERLNLGSHNGNSVNGNSINGNHTERQPTPTKIHKAGKIERD